MRIPAEPFVGRRDAMAELRSALADARAGRPQVVIVEGRAGIGKTTLVERFLAEDRHVHLLRASGEQWEALVPFGVADQLFRTASRADASVRGARDTVLPVEEPVSVGSRLLTLWGEIEDDLPVVTVLDDAHWADLDSLRAVLFALRRLVAERVLVLIVVRTEDVQRVPEGLGRLAGGPSGRVVELGPLDVAEVGELAEGLGAKELPPAVVSLLQQHTEGNPLYIRAMFEESPGGAWSTWESSLPAPTAYRRQVQRRLEACPPPGRRLAEAAAVLGMRTTLAAAAEVADLPACLPALDSAIHANLLVEVGSEDGTVEIAFPHPLIRAAVHQQLGPTRRAALHLAAAVAMAGDETAVLRHRVAAASGPDACLAADLEGFAQREALAGSWARAASALVDAARVAASRDERERLLVDAVDGMVASGDLVRAGGYTAEIAGSRIPTRRDAVLGFLAVLRGHPTEAEQRLRNAWESLPPDADRKVRGVIAQRTALHAVGRLQAAEMVSWARRAVALSEPGEPIGVDAAAILGVGLGWAGDVDAGLATHEGALADPASTPDRFVPSGLALNMAYGWLQLAADDLPGARMQLSIAAPTAVRLGSVRVAVYSYSWLARVLYGAGAWDEAVLAGERAVALLNGAAHEWLRPLVHWAAVAVPAARADWAVAERHVQQAAAHSEDYEIMVAAAALAAAQLATARGDHDAVLRAVEPIRELAARDAIDEPGFWPWQDLYADALISLGRVSEADAFLVPHEARAEARARRSAIARLARVRGRVAAMRGDAATAADAFERGLALHARLSMPFERALIELAYGQALRRDGKRKAAAARLQAAQDRFALLDAQPFLDRCERELIACGLAPARRRDFDAQKLTPQELEVARLVASGLSNRQVAAELLVSIKTVQAHLTRVYAKVGVGSRTELSARLRDGTADPPPESRREVPPTRTGYDGS